jgi:hypothetical protein
MRAACPRRVRAAESIRQRPCPAGADWPLCCRLAIKPEQFRTILGAEGFDGFSRQIVRARVRACGSRYSRRSRRRAGAQGRRYQGAVVLRAQRNAFRRSDQAEESLALEHPDRRRHAKEPASSFLVSVVILGKPDSYDKQRAVSVVVTDKTKKSVVMQRQFSGLAFDRSGRVVKALFVENRTCASIEITARSGDSVRTEALPFECGE